jgi:hypothetical protein
MCMSQEKLRELEEKERLKQQKKQEGLGVIYDDNDGDAADATQKQVLFCPYVCVCCSRAHTCMRARV